MRGVQPLYDIVNPDLFYLATATASDPCPRGGIVVPRAPARVRVRVRRAPAAHRPSLRSDRAAFSSLRVFEGFRATTLLKKNGP